MVADVPLFKFWPRDRRGLFEGDGGGSDELTPDSLDDPMVELSGGKGGGIPEEMPAWSR